MMASLVLLTVHIDRALKGLQTTMNLENNQSYEITDLFCVGISFNISHSSVFDYFILLNTFIGMHIHAIYNLFKNYLKQYDNY